MSSQFWEATLTYNHCLCAMQIVFFGCIHLSRLRSTSFLWSIQELRTRGTPESKLTDGIPQPNRCRHGLREYRNHLGALIIRMASNFSQLDPRHHATFLHSLLRDFQSVPSISSESHGPPWSPKSQDELCFCNEKGWIRIREHCGRRSGSRHRFDVEGVEDIHATR